jgi:hypothetical protein
LMQVLLFLADVPVSENKIEQEEQEQEKDPSISWEQGDSEFHASV